MGNMKSEIWCVHSEKLGSLHAFRSERDMESFLMNNPSIIVGWDSDKSERFPLREQQFVSDGKKGLGRIDIVGLSKFGNDYELRIIELKNCLVEPDAVEQIKWYINDWDSKPDIKKEIKEWIMGMKIPELDEKRIDAIVSNPVGILIGTSFSVEAITKAKELNVNGVRLARFRGDDKSEHYVIIEDQIGDALKKRLWSWEELIEKGLINASDWIAISHNNKTLRAKPDPDKLDWNWIYIIFDDDSKSFILKNEQLIWQNMFPDAKKNVESGLKSLHAGKSIVLTNATAIAFFALGIQLRSFWKPMEYWIHEKSQKYLSDLKEELFS